MSRESLLGMSSTLASLPTFREDGGVMPPEERPSARVLRTGRVQRDMVFGFRRPDGRMVWLSANAQPLTIQGQAGVLTTYHDITEARAADAALRESERRHRALVANLQGMVYRCGGDAERTMQFASEGCRALLGLEPEELTSGRVRYAECIHPHDREQVRAQLEEAEARHAAFTIEYRLHHADGRWVHVVEKGSGVWDAAGTLVAREGFVSDITARVQAEEALRELNVSLERRVAARTEDLTAANRELEAFSYSVSHDLRAPLGAIRGFADALHESVSARLEVQERHFLDRIRAGGERMDTLIDDMLSLSRIARADLVATDIDLTGLAREVVDQLREQHPGRPARIHIHEAMRVHADPGLLRIALTNLVANAWKFSSGRPEAVVEIGEVAQEGLAQRFFVRDEGAGFDPAHSAKLFGTFQRLHSQSEFPGTGVGLATVRRVIERHGGNVWAQGAVGAGATFYFTLPRVTAAGNP
jgi:PAS domain S-box-containing protein